MELGTLPSFPYICIPFGSQSPMENLDDQRKQCATQKKWLEEGRGVRTIYFSEMTRHDCIICTGYAGGYRPCSPVYHHQVSLWGFWHLLGGILSLQVNLEVAINFHVFHPPGLWRDFKLRSHPCNHWSNRNEVVEERCCAACCLASGVFEFLRYWWSYMDPTN